MPVLTLSFFAWRSLHPPGEGFAAFDGGMIRPNSVRAGLLRAVRAHVFSKTKRFRFWKR
jgi:hypothetical protein